MLAFVILNSEAVGCVLFRGSPRRNLVKSPDIRLKGKLNKLFNSPSDGLAYEDDGDNHVAVSRTLDPGTPEHFMDVTHAIRERSSYAVDLIGA